MKLGKNLKESNSFFIGYKTHVHNTDARRICSASMKYLASHKFSPKHSRNEHNLNLVLNNLP